MNEELKTALAGLEEGAKKSIIEEANTLQTKFETKIIEATKDKASTEQLESLKKEYDSSLLNMGTEIGKLKNVANTESPMTFKQGIIKSIKENEKQLLEMTNNSSASVRLKAAANITTANFGTGVVRGFRETEISSLSYAKLFVFDLINVMHGGAGSNPLSWVNRVPKEGTATFQTESDTKSLLDFTYTKGEASADYIAATTITTKQALSNMPMLMNDIENELMINLKTNLDYQVLRAGTAAAPFPASMWNYAKTFSAGSLAGTIPNANMFDVLRVAIGQIRKGEAGILSGGYMPNAIFISEDKFTSMDLQKTSQYAYQFPNFATPDGTIIKGVKVYGTKFLGDDEFLVADTTKYLFNIVEELYIDMNYINDQFIKNQITIRAELMGAGRVKLHETFAFVKGTFNAAQNVINKP